MRVLLYNHSCFVLFVFVLGRAIANRMCASRLPNGNMNSDLGLQTALYIAHEIGHK